LDLDRGWRRNDRDRQRGSASLDTGLTATPARVTFFGGGSIMTEGEIGTLISVLGSADFALALGLGVTTIPGDATLPIDKDRQFLLTKGSAAAITLPDPGAGNIGRRISIMAGSDFAHVVTTTAALANGTAVKNTWTSAAFIGSTCNLRAVSATLWAVESIQLGVFA